MPNQKVLVRAKKVLNRKDEENVPVGETEEFDKEVAAVLVKNEQAEYVKNEDKPAKGDN